jgi:hypothetical protein
MTEKITKKQQEKQAQKQQKQEARQQKQEARQQKEQAKEQQKQEELELRLFFEEFLKGKLVKEREEKKRELEEKERELEEKERELEELHKVSTALKLQAEVVSLAKRLLSEKIALNDLDIQKLLFFDLDDIAQDAILGNYKAFLPNNNRSAMHIHIKEIVEKMKDFLQELLDFSSKEKGLLEFKQHKVSLIHEIISLIPDDSENPAFFIHSININNKPINKIFEDLGIGLIQIFKLGKATFEGADYKTLPDAFFCQALQLIYNEWEGLLKLKVNQKDLSLILEKYQNSGAFKDFIIYVLQDEGLGEKEECSNQAQHADSGDECSNQAQRSVYGGEELENVYAANFTGEQQHFQSFFST